MIEHITSQASKQAMLTDIELRLQQQTLKIHRDFHQLLVELANYRFPEGSITQDSVMALGFAVSNAEHAHARGSGGINRKLFYELNFGTAGPPSWWLDKQKITTDDPGFGLVRVVRDVSDPREISEYQADALTDELETMLAQGWRGRRSREPREARLAGGLQGTLSRI